MDERALKRLLVIVAVSIISIFVFKSMMVKTAVNLNKVAVEKKQAAATTSAQQQDTTAVSDVAATLESPAASGVGEGR
jgi:hypothetical protein